MKELSRLKMYTGRTKKYAEALCREGRENFDYRKWLQQVKEEEAKEKCIAAASASREPSTTSKPNCDIKAAQSSTVLSSPPPTLKINNIQTSRNSARSAGSPNKETRKEERLRQRVVDVCNAWDEFQESRRRDAVYGYLRAVFLLVKRYRGRRRTKKLLWRASKFAGLAFQNSVDPFSVIIRCTSEDLDAKTLSKWSRALRYAAKFKKPRAPLQTFIKDRGGINACATLYAERLGRSKR
jgi:hypothetical protein